VRFIHVVLLAGWTVLASDAVGANRVKPRGGDHSKPGAPSKPTATSEQEWRRLEMPQPKKSTLSVIASVVTRTSQEMPATKMQD